MKHCCINCEYYTYDFENISNDSEEWCDKNNEEIPKGWSEKYCCNNYIPDSYTVNYERAEAEKAAISTKQRLMLRDLKGFLESYNADDYEDNSPDVKAIYDAVIEMVRECDPSRVDLIPWG